MSSYLPTADGARYIPLIINLHQLRRGRIQPFLNYIAFTRPNLREQISNLSAVLPNIAEDNLPSQKLILKTFPCHQLSELSNRPLKKLSQFAIDTINTHQADTIIGPSFNQIFPDKPSSYSLDAIVPVQSTSQDYTSRNLERPSSTAEINNAHPSNFTPEIGANIYPSSPQPLPTL